MEAGRREADGSPRQRLRSAYGRWVEAPLLHHLAAVMTLSLLLAAIYGPWLLQRGPLPDELVYTAAFDAVAAGRPPTSSGDFLYFPVLALVGAWLQEALGRFPTFLTFRLLNLLGLAVTLWLSLAWAPGRWRWRLVLAVAAGSLAPAYRLGMTYGNLSMAVSGMILLGLLFWRRRPWLCGGLLGLSIAVKPLAPVAVGLLGTHRPESEPKAAGPIRSHRWAAVLAFVLSCLLFFGLPYFRDTLGYARPRLVARTLSWHRLPYVLGLEIDPLLLFVLLAFGAFLFVRRRVLSPWLFLAVAIAGTLAATPLVWSHTLILALPIQVLSLQVAWWRWRGGVPVEGGVPPPRIPAALEPVLVLLAVAALQFSVGATSIDDRGTLLQLFGSLPPVLAPAALTGYLLATTGSRPRAIFRGLP